MGNSTSSPVNNNFSKFTTYKIAKIEIIVLLEKCINVIIAIKNLIMNLN